PCVPVGGVTAVRRRGQAARPWAPPRLAVTAPAVPATPTRALRRAVPRSARAAASCALPPPSLAPRPGRAGPGDRRYRRADRSRRQIPLAGRGADPDAALPSGQVGDRWGSGWWWG